MLNLNTQFCLFLFILLAHTFFLLCCKVETESLHDGLFQFYQLNGVLVKVSSSCHDESSPGKVCIKL